MSVVTTCLVCAKCSASIADSGSLLEGYPLLVGHSLRGKCFGLTLNDIERLNIYRESLSITTQIIIMINII